MKSTFEMDVPQAERLEDLIHFVRGQKVLLDSDLGRIYGVPTHRLNEQYRRNKKRFPRDFAFVLKRQGVTNLRSQNAISSLHGGTRYLPVAFTEHGAIMLATVLNSPVAIEASVRVVRAFVHLRELLSCNKQLASQFAELERRLNDHDSGIKTLFDAIRELLKPSTDTAVRREIGFHVKEQSRKYRISR